MSGAAGEPSSGATAFQALLGVPEATAIVLTRLDVLHWGRVVVFEGRAGDQVFELRYDDCRELRWRVYVHDPAPDETQFRTTPLVSFAPGRDQQRSPAQFLTAHFGLSLFYGSVSLISR